MDVPLESFPTLLPQCDKTVLEHVAFVLALVPLLHRAEVAKVFRTSDGQALYRQSRAHWAKMLVAGCMPEVCEGL